VYKRKTTPQIQWKGRVVTRKAMFEEERVKGIWVVRMDNVFED